MFDIIVQPFVRGASRIREFPAVRRIEASTFVRNTTTLVAFTVTAQAINIVLAPVLSRIYSPEDMGAFGLLLTFVHAVAVACNLNYDSAIPAASSRVEGAALLSGSVVIAFFMSTLLGLLFAAFTVLDVAGYGLMPAWSALLIMASLWFAAISSAFHYWAMRTGDFRTMGQSALDTSLVRIVFQLGGGVLGLSWIGLTLGEAVGRVGGAIRLMARHGSAVARLAKELGPSGVWRTIIKFKQFPLVLLPPTLADQLLLAVYMPVITSLFGLTVAGQYFFMRRVLDLPMAVVAKTIADAFHRRIAEKAQSDPHQVRPFMVRVFLLIVTPAAIAALPVVVAGPALFAFVFGEPWRQAGLFAAFTVPALVVNLGVHPVSRVFTLTQRPRLRSAFTVINGCGTVAVFLTAWLAPLGIEAMVAGLAAVSFVSYGAYFVACYVAAGHLITNPAHV